MKTLLRIVGATSVAFAACGGSGSKAAETTPTPTTAAADVETTSPAPTPAAQQPSPAPEQPAPTEDWEILAQDVLAYFDALGKAAEPHAGDCAKQAAAMNQTIAANQDVVRRAKAMDNDEEMNRKFGAKYGEQAKTVIMTLMGHVKDCTQDPNMQKTLEAMTE